MSEQKHTIEDLFSDSGAFDETEVVKALQLHVTIQRSTNRIFLKDTGLSIDRKILAYGLAKKLLFSKQIIESEMVSAQEFHAFTGIKKGSVDPAFKLLKEKGYLVGKGEYEIPTHKISTIIEMLQKTK